MLIYVALCVVCTFLDALDAATYASIVGYAPGNDVKQHLRLDLDQKNISTAVAALDLVAAYKAYSVGEQCVFVILHDWCQCCLSVCLPVRVYDCICVSVCRSICVSL